MSDDFDGDDDFDADDEFETRPLPTHEAALVRRDIDDLAAFRRAFESEGYKGVSLFCTDCVEDHYYGWDMLEGNLRTLLESGDYPVHEPPFDPRPEEYVNWEYAQGYVDGVSDALPPDAPARVADHCPFCASPLGDVAGYAMFCPSCGTPLGIATVADALLAQGWQVEDVRDLFHSARLPLPGLEEGPEAPDTP